MEMKPPRFVVQDAVAHFLSLTQIVSECEEDSAYRAREIYAFEVMFRTHLFNDLSQDEAKEVFFTARNEQVEASKAEGLDALNTAKARTLAMSGYTMTAVAAMLDYAMFWEELDEVRRSYVDLLCTEAAMSTNGTLESLLPAFRALYAHWAE